MAQTVFDVQELCDHICDDIALLASSYDDLRSTALVCHTLSISAQSRIFRHISLEPWELVPRGRQALHLALQSVVSASIRLAAILSASPRLLRSTHRLSIIAQSKVLFPLSSIRFPALQKLRLNFSWTATSDSDAFHLARDFVGLPSICDVGLHSLYYNPEPERLVAIFDASVPHLNSVTFVAIFTRPSLPAACVPRSREQRAQIKRLKLVLADDLDPWLISPQCPFDFSRLVHVVIEAKESLALLQVLTSARLTITHLALFGAITSQVNLSEFPALTCLELRHSNWQPLHSLGLDNCLESLVLYFPSYAFQTHPESLSEMDAFVANSTMPSLQEVEVRFGGEKSELKAITSYCPQLLARGLLAVTTHPDRTRSA
ncbi:hypothetical protein DFH09DRAFT_1173822 [Mycena vulgaris]|nr:hypothetical protein DFH09DRAFT_1210483 [Mycena vulgaris]KAJ6542443.1 hypothetical protein DFH09DRAFT_1173822 [Mycena vulgaris]